MPPPENRTIASAIARYAPFADEGGAARATVDLLESARERWSHLYVITSMMEVYFMPRDLPLTPGSTWVRVAAQRRGDQECFSFALMREVANPQRSDPTATVALTIGGDICTLPRAPQVLESFLYQVLLA